MNEWILKHGSIYLCFKVCTKFKWHTCELLADCTFDWFHIRSICCINIKKKVCKEASAGHTKVCKSVWWRPWDVTWPWLEEEKGGCVVLMEALEAWSSSQEQSQDSKLGPFYTSFSNTIVPQSSRLQHCVSSDPTPRETTKSRSDTERHRAKRTNLLSLSFTSCFPLGWAFKGQKFEFSIQLMFDQGKNEAEVTKTPVKKNFPYKQQQLQTWIV